MLESVSLRNVATYDDNGVRIYGLKKVNFIYGANGSGKTTISNLIDQPLEDKFSDCSMIWKGQIPLKALVYNRDFREKNFGKDEVNGIFTLGQATKEEILAIEVMQVELRKIKEENLKKEETLDTQSKEKKKLEEEFKESSWINIYKKYENYFKEAFSGSMKKESFKDRIINEFKNNSSETKTFDELIEKVKIIFGKVPEPLDPISTIEFERLIEIENDTIWEKKIIGKADVQISELIQKLDINDWVNEGRGYLQDNDTCPFCQELNITKKFREQLENYFDEAFVTDTALVKSLADEYILISQNLLNLLSQIEENEKSKSNSKLSIELFSANVKTLSNQFLSNRELLKTKLKESSRSINLTLLKEQLENVKKFIITANVEIEGHNDVVINYTKEKDDLVSNIWKFLIEENRTFIQSYLKNSNDRQKGIDALGKKCLELNIKYREQDKEIKEASKNVTSVQSSVDEINKILTSYGFLNFEIKPSKINKNQYQIQREDGSAAESTLSEGEITFLTFLYFLQLSKGSISENSITDERILVVDDPISSLDSNVLFVVSSLLKEIIKSTKKNEGNIKQIILLTHNVYFHKEVSFVDGRTNNNNDTFYWILRKKDKISAVQRFDIKNPIQNSYELLWQELKNLNHNSHVTIQNVMRRIIENYFKILGKYADDDLIKSFEDKQKQNICRSLVCWINDGSHCISDDLFIEHQETVLDNYMTVFEQIFMQMNQHDHYKMMMR